MADEFSYVGFVERLGSFGLWAVTLFAYLFRLYPAQRKAEEDREKARVKLDESHATAIGDLIASKDKLALDLTNRLVSSIDKAVETFALTSKELTNQLQKHVTDTAALVERLTNAYQISLDKERMMAQTIADLAKKDRDQDRDMREKMLLDIAAQTVAVNALTGRIHDLGGERCEHPSS